jgi:CBS domain-containing protein
MAKVRDVMSADVETIPVGSTLGTALEVMWRRDIGSVPVVDLRGRLVGIITDRDVALASYLRDEKPSHIRVSSSMSGNVATCGPDESLATVEARMCEARVRRLPVVDALGAPVGMLTLSDLARGQDLHGEISGALIQTLRAISQPRDLGL